MTSAARAGLDVLGPQVGCPATAGSVAPLPGPQRDNQRTSYHGFTRHRDSATYQAGGPDPPGRV